jgi:hypothetical protein
VVTVTVTEFIVTRLRSGVPWYNVEWRDHPGGNTWEPAKNLCGEDGVVIVRLFEEERQRLAEAHLRSKVRFSLIFLIHLTI